MEDLGTGAGGRDIVGHGLIVGSHGSPLASQQLEDVLVQIGACKCSISTEVNGLGVCIDRHVIGQCGVQKDVVLQSAQETAILVNQVEVLLDGDVVGSIFPHGEPDGVAVQIVDVNGSVSGQVIAISNLEVDVLASDFRCALSGYIVGLQHHLRIAGEQFPRACGSSCRQCLGLDAFLCQYVELLHGSSITKDRCTGNVGGITACIQRLTILIHSIVANL